VRSSDGVLRPLRRPLPFVVVGLLLIAILGVAVRGHNALTRFDADAVDAVAADRTAAIVDVARAVTDLGSALWGGLALLLIGAVLAAAGRLRPLAAFLPVLSMEVGGLAAAGVKGIVQRPRPPLALHEVVERSSGFPSGHSTQSAAGWLALGLVLALGAGRPSPEARPRPGSSAPRPPFARGWVVAGASVAVLVGVSRVVLGVHSPSDVVAGWTLGALCAVVIVGAALRSVLHRRPDGAVDSAATPGT
jgi:membrane-associated phospholipid phosphatase